MFSGSIFAVMYTGNFDAFHTGKMGDKVQRKKDENECEDNRGEFLFPSGDPGGLYHWLGHGSHFTAVILYSRRKGKIPSLFASVFRSPQKGRLRNPHYLLF
jgi:hypothetical protein